MRNIYALLIFIREIPSNNFFVATEKCQQQLLSLSLEYVGTNIALIQMRPLHTTNLLYPENSG